MASKYQKRHYEDVAGIIAGLERIADDGCITHGTDWRLCLADEFRSLFALDNPACCTHCGALDTTMVCVTAGGRSYDEHNFEGGFDRERFLKACGLESEG